MADINFLSDNNNGREEKGEKDKKTKQEIEWTRPSKDKSVSSPIAAEKGGGGKKSGWFSFAKKEKLSAIADPKKEDALDKFLDRDKIKKSRAEVLRLIKEKERVYVKEEKIKTKKRINFSWFKTLFKRKEKNKKKIKEEIKEEIFPTILPKQINKKWHSEPLPVKHEIVKEKIKKPSWMDKLLNSWRIFLANRQKAVVKKETFSPPPKPAARAEENNNFKEKKPSWLDKLIESWRALLAKKEKEKTALKKEPDIGIQKKSIKIKVDIFKYFKGAFKLSKKAEKKEEKEEKKEIKKIKKLEEDVKEWKNPKILETNLIKGELASFFDWKKGSALLAVYVFVACSIIAAIYGGLIFWGGKKKGAEIIISNKLDDLHAKIKPLEEKAEKIIITQKRIAAAANILNGHIYWTNFFKFLEDNTLADVYYLGGFSGDNKGEYAFSASAKDFRTILEQINLLRANEYVSDVSVSGGSVSVSTIPGEDGEPESERVIQGVDFSLKIKIKPELFTK